MPRVKVEYRMASKENYKRFIKEKQKNISFDQWCAIIYGFNSGIRDYCLETGKCARLPWGLGEVVVSKKKRVKENILPSGEVKINLAVDWAKTRKHGKYIYHMNFHSQGFNFKWKWFSKNAKFKHYKLFVFKPSRISSRLIAHYVKQNYGNKYMEWHLIKK